MKEDEHAGRVKWTAGSSGGSEINIGWSNIFFPRHNLFLCGIKNNFEIF